MDWTCWQPRLRLPQLPPSYHRPRTAFRTLPCSGGFQACRHGQSIVWHRSCSHHSRPQTRRLTLRFAAGITTASASSGTASIAMPAGDTVGPTCSWSVHSDKGRAGPVSSQVGISGRRPTLNTCNVDPA